MIKHKIKKLVGNSELVSVLNKLIANDLANTILEHPSILLDRGPGGTRVKVNFQDAPARTTITQYQLATVHPDYLECHPLKSDGTVNMDVSHNIAKPHGLRKTGWDGQTINGIAYSAYSADGTQRTATIGGKDAVEKITPDYVAAFSVIVAYGASLDLTADDGSKIRLLDANDDGRQWAKQ